MTSGTAPNDSQFLHWCEVDGVWPVAAKPIKTCGEKSRGQWDHYPITVSAQPVLIPETKEAIAYFNRSLGFKLFSYIEFGETDVAVVTGGSSLAEAMAFHHSVEGVHKGLVVTFNGLGLAHRPDIIAHELGHIVGLRHDRQNQSSLMHHTPKTRLPTLEARDVRALRQRYKVN